MTYDMNSLRVRHSYMMARQIAHAVAEIKQHHYQQQQTDPTYWDRDKFEQEVDGVQPDPKTGVAVPSIRYAVPAIEYPNGEPDAREFNARAQAERDDATAEEQKQAAEVEQNNAGLMNMIRAAPKVLSAMTKPADSPMALKRLEVCKGCEHWTGSKCRKCGCFTSLKVRLPSEACPIGKWGKEG